MCMCVCVCVYVCVCLQVGNENLKLDYSMGESLIESAEIEKDKGISIHESMSARK